MSLAHISCSQEPNGTYTIHIDGELRGEYNSPEMMLVHLAKQIAECDRLQLLLEEKARKVN